MTEEGEAEKENKEWETEESEDLEETLKIIKNSGSLFVVGLYVFNISKYIDLIHAKLFNFYKEFNTMLA